MIGNGGRDNPGRQAQLSLPSKNIKFLPQTIENACFIEILLSSREEGRQRGGFGLFGRFLGYDVSCAAPPARGRPGCDRFGFSGRGLGRFGFSRFGFGGFGFSRSGRRRQLVGLHGKTLTVEYGRLARGLVFNTAGAEFWPGGG